MSLPIRHLPVIQNWDCHVSGNCCKEYVVTITDEERQRIEAQGWDKDPQLAGQSWYTTSGPFWNRRYHLRHHEDGSCVFLSEEGRCRIHEKFGFETKPLPCRLYPFVLVPVGDHWRVGLRFACPSVAANRGRNVTAHEQDLRTFAAELARREGLTKAPEGNNQLPPVLQGRQRVAWPDLLRFVDSLLALVQNRKDRIERRLRKCLALADLCRQAKFDALSGGRLTEFLRIVCAGLDQDVPLDPATVPLPSWVGRVLFRQAAALFTRKDQGPDRGVARQGRMALMQAAWEYAQGRGTVPRMNRRFPETTFEQIEATPTVLPPEAEDILERYYTVKLESLHFCGAANFHLPFWEGLELLVLTFPIMMWTARAFQDRSRVEAVLQALTMVDDHFGYNRVLSSRRQRVSLNLLARTGELTKLVAWYAR